MKLSGTNARIVLISSAIAIVAGCASHRILEHSSHTFTIPVLPDTQEAVTRKNEMFFSQMQWIADKKDSLKTPIVLHVGDVANFDTITHWATTTRVPWDGIAVPRRIRRTRTSG